MAKKINPTIEVQQTKTGNFGPLFDGKDISEAELTGEEQPEKERNVPGAQESKGDSTIALPEGSPPGDDRCDCCGRYIGDLNPFGGPEDLLMSAFTGALLSKKEQAPRPL